MDEPTFRPGWHLFRCWRGPSWMNTAWLLLPALRRHGYAAEAERVLAGLLTLVDRHGFREYYNPLTGDGLAARRFGWSTLLVDLLAREASGPGAAAPLSAVPYTGSVARELWARSAEAVRETGRRLR
jgi:glycogen debranching enzyme